MALPYTIANGPGNMPDAAQLMANFNALVQKAGDTMTGTLNFTTLQSVTANPASTGALRLANADQFRWRNSGNSADVALRMIAGDYLEWTGNMQFDGTVVINKASLKLFLDSAGTTNQIGSNYDVGTIPNSANTSASISFLCPTATAQMLISLSAVANAAPTSVATFSNPTSSIPSLLLASGTGAATAYPVLQVSSIGNGGGQAQMTVERGTGTLTNSAQAVIHGTSSGLYLVIGANGIGGVFIDVVLNGYATVNVMSSITSSAPARTYTVSSGTVSVSLGSAASPTYNVNAVGLTLVQG